MAVSATSAFTKFDSGLANDNALITGSTYTVKDTAGLLNVLKTAKSGDIVYLQSGTYSSVNLNNIQINGNVTIASLNTGKPAVLADLRINNSKGLTLSGLELDASVKKADMGYQVLNSSNITMDKLYVHGTLNNDASDDVRALLVRNSTNVTVSNSKFEQLTDALSHIDSNTVTFANNSFTGLRDNGIVGGGTSNLTIRDNRFTNFDHSGDIHPDAIQVWTSNTRASASNITISGNTFDRGTGSIVQGIWMRDEVGNLPFKNVTITNNTIVGAAYNGIGVGHVDGLVLTGNTVTAVEGQPSWISLNGTTNSVVTDNAAIEIKYVGFTGVRSGNVVSGYLTQEETPSFSSWIAANIGKDSFGRDLVMVLNGKGNFKGFVDEPQVGYETRGFAFAPTMISGSAKADSLYAGPIGDHIIDGRAGNDTLTGNARGTTTMLGGAGDDTYVVRGVNDIVVETANDGTDTVVTYVDYTMTANVENVRLMASSLTVHGNGLANSMSGSAGDNIMYGEGGNDGIQGGAGQDILYGGAGNDTLKGDDGNDRLYGEDGNDLLYGGLGDDLLDSGAGVNILEGGAGADKLYGGSGQDTFTFRSGDFQAGLAKSVDDIYNFSSAQKDKIHLGGLDANTRTTVDDAFKLIGTSDFHKVAGELRYEVVGKDSYILGDTNGDGVADVKIHVVGVMSLSAADFVL